MNCEDCRQLLVDYLYEEIDASTRTRVEDALARCPDCRDELAELRQTMFAFDTLEPLEVPAKLHNDILRQARIAAVEAHPRRSAFAAFFAGPAFGVVFSVFLLGGGAWLFHELTFEGPDYDAPSSVSALASASAEREARPDDREARPDDDESDESEMPSGGTVALGADPNEQPPQPDDLARELAAPAAEGLAEATENEALQARGMPPAEETAQGAAPVATAPGQIDTDGLSRSAGSSGRGSAPESPTGGAGRSERDELGGMANMASGGAAPRAQDAPSPTPAPAPMPAAEPMPEPAAAAHPVVAEPNEPTPDGDIAANRDEVATRAPREQDRGRRGASRPARESADTPSAPAAAEAEAGGGYGYELDSSGDRHAPGSEATIAETRAGAPSPEGTERRDAERRDNAEGGEELALGGVQEEAAAGPADSGAVATLATDALADERASDEFDAGIAHYDHGNYARAASAFDAFVASAPSSDPRRADALYLAATSNLRMGRDDAARTLLERFLASHPSHRYAADARVLLEEIERETVLEAQPMRQRSEPAFDAEEEAAE